MKLHRVALVLFALAPTPALAQDADRDDVLATIARMFEGLTNQDTAQMRSTLYPGARLIQTFTGESGPATRAVDMDRFLSSIAGNTGPRLEERYWAPEVRIHDNLASVWISYSFFRGDELSHCGEDNFQLARTPEGWRIIALADTQRREGCEHPG
jgi:hypothetical protein